MKQRTVVPVFTPREYPLFLALPGTEDMPHTWEEWRQQFDALLLQTRAEGDSLRKVRIRPDRFRTWFEENALAASPAVRQRYAEVLLEEREGNRTPSQTASQLEPERRNLAAIPVYTVKDYRAFQVMAGAGDMPSSWKAWRRQLQRSPTNTVPAFVRLKPRRFEIWAAERSLQATAEVRQRYAEELLNERTIYREASDRRRKSREQSVFYLSERLIWPIAEGAARNELDYPPWVDGFAAAVLKFLARFSRRS